MGVDIKRTAQLYERTIQEGGHVGAMRNLFIL